MKKMTKVTNTKSRKSIKSKKDSTVTEKSSYDLVNTLVNGTKIVALGLIVAVGLSYAFAWTAPDQAPPSGNVSAPVNVGLGDQYKPGAFGVGGVFETDNDAHFALFGGNVGIGTAVPTEKLHIRDELSPAIKIVDWTNGVDTHWYANDIQGAVGTGSNHNFSIFTNDTDRMVVTNTGNVGIGNTNPQRDLHIGDGTGEAWIKLTSNNVDTTSGIEFDDDLIPDSQLWKLERFSSDDTMRFTKMGKGYHMVIEPDGDIGIGGIINPDASLDIDGDLRISGDKICYYSCYTSGTQVFCDKKRFDTGATVQTGVYMGFTSSITPNVGEGQLVTCSY